MLTVIGADVVKRKLPLKMQTAGISSSQIQTALPAGIVNCLGLL